MKLLLASQSATRRRMLEAAGVAFEPVPAALDEEEAKAGLLAAGFEPRDLAEMLAEMKAKSVADAGDALVIGADQMLELDDGTMLSKPRLARRGAGAAAPAERRRPIISIPPRWWSRAASASGARPRAWRWTSAPLGDDFLEAYLDAEYEAVRFNVGGYRVEGMGAQLFEEIDGSHFAVLGLPLLPLLAYLRERGLLLELMGIPYAEVIGDPIAHSKSPLIHKFWLEKLGIEGDYRAARRSPRKNCRAISRRGAAIRTGAAATSPSAQASVLPFVERLTRDCREIRRGQRDRV